MLWKLIKIRLQSLFSNKGSQKKKTNQKGRAILIGLLFVYCAVAFGIMFYFLFDAIAQSLLPVPNLRWFYFALTGLLAFALSFFFTAFTAKSELFEAKDNELLLSMPIKPRTILLSRMAILLGSEYLFSLLVFGTSGAAWFGAAGMDGLELVLFLVGSLALPLLGASLAALVGWLLARLTAKARNKTLVTMIFSLGFLGIYFYVYFNAQTYIQQLLVNYQAVAEGIAGWGFLFAWYGKGIAEANIPLLLGVVALCLGVFAVAVLLISRGFLHISSSAAKTGRKMKPVKVEAASLSAALLRKELKRFTSSAVYMMNCGLGLILELAAAVLVLVKLEAIREVVGNLGAFGLNLTPVELAVITAVLLSFFSSMSIITSPSVSMEGKNLWILKEAPIPAGAVLWAKLKLHLLLCCPPTLILSVAAGIALETKLWGWVCLLLIPQLYTLLTGAFGLMMNLLLPKLEWTNETVPVKQSAAPDLTMLGMMAYTMIGMGGFVFLVLVEKLLPASVFLGIIVGAAALWCLLTLLWLYHRGPKRFERL